MRIRRIETFCTQYAGLVRVAADSGQEGWGQVSTYHADISALVLHRQVAPHALGADVAELSLVEQLTETVLAREHKFPGSHLCRAVGGLETALWDLHGKLQQKTVCELLGGTPRPFRAYASSMRRDISPEEEAKRFLQLQNDNGFDAFKFRVGKECGQDQDEWQGRTEKIIPEMRRALGDNVALLADANSCYSPARAIEVGRMLEDSGICHFEEPCPYWRPDWTQQATRALSVDVCGGEQDNNLALWQYMIEGGVMNVAQPDICYLGGMFRTLKVAEMARRVSMPVTPHCANLSLVTVFTLHLMGALPNAGPYLEFSIEDDSYYPWQYGIYDPMPEVINGKAQVSGAPGWGIEPRQEWLQKSEYKKSEMQE